MKQRKPMSRGTGFARPVYERAPAAPLRRIERSGTYAATVAVISVPKVIPVVSEPYRRLVAMLPCKVCGIAGLSQAAHPNTGKGAGTKTDDRLCFPLCCDSPGRAGCHPRFDQGALFSKDARRLLEPAWGADTRRWILANNLWPKGLPLWSEE